MHNKYEDYIQTGFALINELIVKAGFKYNTEDYESVGRRESEDVEKNLLFQIFEESADYEPLSLNPDCEVDKSNGNYWYHYYKCIIPGLEEVFVYIPLEHRSRHWFDLAFKFGDNFFPINIKVTNGQTKDNLFGSMTLSYLLFGYDFEGGYGVKNMRKINSEADLAQKIIDGMEQKEIFNIEQIRDYFFLTINKSNGNFTISSFFNIPKEDITINPRNLFQGCLDYNTEEAYFPDEIDFEKNIFKVIQMFFEYTEKKSAAFKIMQDSFK